MYVNYYMLSDDELTISQTGAEPEEDFDELD